MDDDALADRRFAGLGEIVDQVVVELAEMSWPNTGPVISDSVLSNDSSACCGERSTEVL